jgi:hypothetical protein
MSPTEPTDIYQLRVFVKGISPMVWRRILVRSDTTIADLHEIIQILMNWYDVYLHHFLIRGKRYGIGRIGTMGFMDNPHKITLSQFQFRHNETFIYEYNYFDAWELKIRLEEKAPFDPERFYPYCCGGNEPLRQKIAEELGVSWNSNSIIHHSLSWNGCKPF